VTSAESLLRERIIEGAYACVQHFGLGKTTVADVVRLSGVSRSSVYRCFPGGKEQLMHEVVAWEMDRFFAALAGEVSGAPDLESKFEVGLVFAQRAISRHAVLQKVLETEPERLLPLLTTESHRPLRYITAYVRSLLDAELRHGRLRPGVDPDRTADYVARVLLSLISTPGVWDLSDPLQVAELVRGRILAGLRAAGPG